MAYITADAKYIQDALFDAAPPVPVDQVLADHKRRISELELEIERLDDLIGRLYETACTEQGENMARAFDEAP